MTVTRIKPVKDPFTGEVVGLGPKEIYAQERRDYNEHPRTEGETRQLSKWTIACRMAPAIFKDKNHPRFMEFYNRWKAQLKPDGENMQFPNFVRTMLVQELGEE